MLSVGSLKQKANPVLVVFVLICISVTVGLLYLMQKSMAVADNISLKTGKYESVK
jgi:hypothetical protein